MSGLGDFITWLHHHIHCCLFPFVQDDMLTALRKHVDTSAPTSEAFAVHAVDVDFSKFTLDKVITIALCTARGWRDLSCKQITPGIREKEKN